MVDVKSALDANRSAVDELIAAAEKCGAAWTAPRAPGKWSPSQVVEHVALALEESANVVSGAPSKFPTLPAFVRPLVRGLLFRRVLKRNAFPKAKTNKAMDPASGPSTTVDARIRLEGALAKFDQACRERVANAQSVQSTVFGTVSVADYARFMAVHTRHHRKQVPTTD